MVDCIRTQSVPTMSRLSQKALVANAIPKEDASETTDASYPRIPTAIPVDDPTFLPAVAPIRQSGRRVCSDASTSVSSSPLSFTNVVLSVLTGVVLTWFVCMNQHTSITRVEWERLQRAHSELDARLSATQEQLQRAHVELDAHLSATQEQLQRANVELDARLSATQEQLQRAHVELDAHLSATQEQLQRANVELDARLSATQEQVQTTHETTSHKIHDIMTRVDNPQPSQLQNLDLAKTVPVFTDSSARKRMQSRMCPLCACRTSQSSTCQSLVKRARDTFANFEGICTICIAGASPNDHIPADEQIDLGLAMMDKSVSRQGCPVLQWLLNQDLTVSGIMQILRPNLLHDIQEMQKSGHLANRGDGIRVCIVSTEKTYFYRSMKSQSDVRYREDEDVERLVQPFREHLPFFADTSLKSNLRDVVQKVRTGLSAMHIKNAELSSLTTEIVFWFYAGHHRYSPWQCQRLDQCRNEIESGHHSTFRTVIAISEHARVEIG